MSRKGRPPSPEEEQLWRQIADTTKPMKKPSLLVRKSEKAKTAQRPKDPIKPFQLGEKAPAPKTQTRITPPVQPLQMDKKAFAKLKRGKSAPEARIDLHGMTVDVAHSALTSFLLRAHAGGKRLVLVITGKGEANASQAFGSQRGVLRRQVPIWLDQQPLRQIVLQTTTAHQRHGGSGALYVYLRR